MHTTSIFYYSAQVALLCTSYYVALLCIRCTMYSYYVHRRATLYLYNINYTPSHRLETDHTCSRARAPRSSQCRVRCTTRIDMYARVHRRATRYSVARRCIAGQPKPLIIEASSQYLAHAPEGSEELTERARMTGIILYYLFNESSLEVAHISYFD